MQLRKISKIIDQWALHVGCRYKAIFPPTYTESYHYDPVKDEISECVHYHLRRFGKVDFSFSVFFKVLENTTAAEVVLLPCKLH